MLLRPPTINQQQADNLSKVITESDAQRSSRSKNKIKKKQSSLPFRNKQTNSNEQQQQRQRQNDIGSVRSHASARSKKSKKKQSSIGKKPRQPILSNSPQPQQLQVLDYQKMHINQPHQPNKLYNFEQPQQKQQNIITTAYNYSPINENRSPNVYNNFHKNAINYHSHQQQQQFGNRDREREEVEEEVPVVKLVENSQRNVSAFNYANPNSSISPKVVERRETRKLGQLFEENRKYTQNSSELGYSASASDFNNSGLAGQSRRSKSKLGQLFKEKSKEKQIRDSKISLTQNPSYNIDNSALQSQWKGPDHQQKMQSLGSRSREKISATKNNLPQKVLQESIKSFQHPEQINKSQLNLSFSRNSPAGSKMQSADMNNKDSVCFNLQPERERKKKGLGLASKMQKQQQLIKISGNLQSKQIQPMLPNRNNQQPQHSKISEKQIAAHQKLKMNFQQNQRYLVESGIMMNHDHNRKKQEILKMEEEVRKKQIQLQRQKAAIQEKNRLERIKIQEQRLLQKRKQQELRNQQQRLRRQEEKRKQEARREEVRREEQRIRAEQNKQRLRKQEVEIQKQKLQKAQKQLQQQRRNIQNQRREMELKMKKQSDQKIRMEAEKQRQRLRQAYNKQKQEIRRKHQDNQKSLIYELESQELNKQKNTGKLQHIQSTYSRDESQHSSRSKQSKKSTRKKEGVISRNTKKHLVADASPRAQESFYEENSEKQKQVEKQQKIIKAEKTMQIPRKLMSFNESEDFSSEQRNQYKTDTYFYDKSSKAHSRPPLSKKSSSKSKPKQGLIEKKTKESQIKVGQQPKQKKLSIVQIAMRKNYQPESGSEYNSQDSFRSKGNSSGSQHSKNSMNSRGSKKKESTVRVKENNLLGNRAHLYIKTSSENQDNYMIRTERHQRQMREKQRQAQLQRKRQQKPTVIKGVSFIDEKGRLIQNGNMVIQGSQVTGYSTSKNQFTQQKFIQKLKNSRAKRRSQSRQRSLNKSRASSKSGQKNSRYERTAKNEYVQSEAYSETQYQPNPKFQTSANFYDTGRKNNNFYSSNAMSNANYTNSNSKAVPQSLQQFVKPIEEAGISRGNQAQVNKKRSMQRTQRV